MALKCTTPPTIDPVRLEEAKSHLIVSHDEDNGLIADLVSAATKLVEAQTGRQLLTANWTLYADRFDLEMQLRLCPVQSIESVKYIDVAGALQTLSSATYQLDAVSEPARLTTAYGYYWPDTREELNAVRVEFVAGYGGRLDVPKEAKQAILLLVGHWYEHREAVGQVGTEIALAYESLVSSLRWCVV